MLTLFTILMLVLLWKVLFASVKFSLYLVGVIISAIFILPLLLLFGTLFILVFHVLVPLIVIGCIATFIFKAFSRN